MGFRMSGQKSLINELKTPVLHSPRSKCWEEKLSFKYVSDQHFFRKVKTIKAKFYPNWCLVIVRNVDSSVDRQDLIIVQGVFEIGEKNCRNRERIFALVNFFVDVDENFALFKINEFEIIQLVFNHIYQN